MGNRHPITIFTDQSQAMTNAIKEVFPNTKHRLCMWHLSQNAGKHLSHQLSVPGFKEIFNKCVYGCRSELEFEEIWFKMIVDYDLTDHKWMGKPVYAARDSGILRQAAEVYNLAIFDEFKREFYDTLHLVAKGYSQDGDHYVHVLQQETKTVDFVVTFNPLCGSVTCSCKNFESKGLLCCHALKVLNLHGVSVITSNYILKRWTKDVKKGAKQVGSNSLNDGTSKPSVTLTRNYLLHKAYKAINQSVLDGNGVKIAEKYLSAWVKEIENHVADINISSDDSSNSNDDGNGDIDSDRNHILQVKNPTKRRPVGESNVRLKGALEKRKKSTNREHARNN
ncbi:protein FAR1-RELATED SEQUENCE 5-like [Silene latifolia]|uniref:protein FAR1-RELATED SEQUENCE 5-like n=1 Tax=Silene latifolia TaxID=37657 RepID=UPI003D77D5E6